MKADESRLFLLWGSLTGLRDGTRALSPLTQQTLGIWQAGVGVPIRRVARWTSPRWRRLSFCVSRPSRPRRAVTSTLIPFAIHDQLQAGHPYDLTRRWIRTLCAFGLSSLEQSPIVPSDPSGLVRVLGGDHATHDQRATRDRVFSVRARAGRG